MPPTVSNIARSIQSGSMNLTSNTIRQRQNSGLRQTSTDRGNIPSTIPSVQRRTSTDIPRPRLTSVSSNERRESNATNDESSDDQQKNDSPSPPLDSRLRHGGLTGLQNLGNTVSIFFSNLLRFIFFSFKCFMNSVLQCLSNTKPLLQFCLKENLPELYNTSSTSVMKGALMRGKERSFSSLSSHSI
jgi:hypothetical protein